MLDIFKRPITVIIIVGAIVIALIWSYVDKRIQSNKEAAEAKKITDAAQIITNLTNIDPKDYDELVKAEYQKAVTNATAADPNNAFSALVVELPGDLALNSGNDRFVFTSPDNAANNWTITFSELTGNFIRAIIPKSDYLGELKPVNTNLWKFQYVTAIQIAEQNGGKTFRENNSLTGVTLTLKHGDPNNWLAWTVEYNSKDNKFVKQVDANSGKTIDSISTTGDQASSVQ
ncbi:MAG: hypothetical protein WC080_01030 [Patescibacteria group bacterium]